MPYDRHPADRLEEFGFKRTSAGRWKGRVNGRDVVVAVDRTNPNQRDEEDFWEAELVRYGRGGRATQSVATRSSERSAIDAAADHVEALLSDARGEGSVPDDFDFGGGF